MCGRYQFSDEQLDEIREIARAIDRKDGAGAGVSGEITPAMRAPVLLSQQERIVPELLTWGFQGPKSLIINARAETLPERPMFRGSFQDRRCIIPASAFFEWSEDKRKYLFTLPDGSALYMAGLYEEHKGVSRFTIITTEANASVRDIHHRMPVVLQREAIKPWLFDGSAAKEILREVPPELEREEASPQLRLW